MTCEVEGCDRPLRSSGLTYCGMHYARVRRTGQPGPAHQVYGMGIKPGCVNKRSGYREVHRDGRLQKEHRYVMSQALGRPLLATEDVHHINGDRADNRLENLELWSTDQPRGQRVADKVAHAIEVLRRYAPGALAEGCESTE